MGLAVSSERNTALPVTAMVDMRETNRTTHEQSLVCKPPQSLLALSNRFRTFNVRSSQCANVAECHKCCMKCRRR